MGTSQQVKEPWLTVDVEKSPERDFAVTKGPYRESRAAFRRLLTIGEMVVDFFTTAGALVFSYGLYRWCHLGKQLHYSHFTILQVAIVFAIVSVWILERNGAYRPDNSLLLIKETERILRSFSGIFLATLCLSLFAHYLISRWVIAIAFLLVPMFLITEKQIVASIVSALHSRGYGQRRVVIYGAGETGRRIFSALLRSPKLGLDPIACFDKSRAETTIFETSYKRRHSATVSRGLPTTRALKKLNAQMVIIADPSISQNEFSQIAAEAHAAGATISFVPNHFAPSDYWVDYMNLDGMLMASFEAAQARGGYEAVKRFVDLALALSLLVLLSPLFVVIGALILFTSSGPVFFVHERVGPNGKRFKMLKFRTMHVDASPYAFCPKERDDPRVTNVGQFLRKTSFDELPQLVNVILGNMSLVGPRPEMPFIVEEYNSLERQRLVVKPGITGLWQLSADRKSLIHENLEYDLYYIRNRNFFMDMAILFHTAIFAMRGI
jgi:exopolysaccharide biosynthesis polyprenyl glycosylphosphotransferase